MHACIVSCVGILDHMHFCRSACMNMTHCISVRTFPFGALWVDNLGVILLLDSVDYSCYNCAAITCYTCSWSSTVSIDIPCRQKLQQLQRNVYLIVHVNVAMHIHSGAGVWVNSVLNILLNNKLLWYNACICPLGLYTACSYIACTDSPTGTPLWNTVAYDCQYSLKWIKK